MQTVIGLNNAIAVKRWSAILFTDQARESYWGSRFTSKAQDAPVPVQVLTDLESEAGDTITYDLFAQLIQQPVFGDDLMRGKEEALKNYSDKISIDQVRCGVNAGGRMTRKRTLHDLRVIARQKMGEWWARFADEVNFNYAAGARGSNADYIMPTTFAGFSGNALSAPDNDHIIYGGVATSFATIANNDQFDLGIIDRAVTRAATYGGGADGHIKINPIKINGMDAFVCCMHTFQEHSLRTNTSTLGWADIQKALALNMGDKAPLFTGALGMYRGVVLHSHSKVVRFNNAGVDQQQPAARALFMGRQSLVQAYGSPGQGLRYDWHEETEDRGNQVVITSGTIMGVKKAQFKGKDFGLLSLDTYAADPNPPTTPN